MVVMELIEMGCSVVWYSDWMVVEGVEFAFEEGGWEEETMRIKKMQNKN